ncbi:MAG: hypothetical protein ACQESU_05515, partial [Halobacteriota archaeon]
EYWYIRDYGKMLDFYARTKTESNILLSLIKVSLILVKLISPFIQWFTDKRKFKVQTDHYKCFLCTDCDDSFTELWKKNRKEKTTTISRDAKTLKWLYFSEAVAEKRHVIKCTDTRNNELVGYFVVDIEYPEKDIKIMQLKDAYIPKFKEGILLSLIAFSIDMNKRHNVAGTLFWSIDQEMDEIMKKRIRVKRKHKRTYMYHFVNQDNSSGPQEEEDEFIPSPIDPDRGVL